MPPAVSSSRRPAPASRTVAVSGGLGVLVMVVFAGVLRNGFVNLDDDLYVCANPHVQTGLSWANVQWACTNLEGAFWHPLTWLSHMLDCQLYGLRPWGHH